MASWKNELSLLIGFSLLVSYTPVRSQDIALYIYPKDPTFYVGSDVTVNCKLSNGTHDQIVATNWTDWTDSTEPQPGAREEYMITNIKQGFHLIECQYNHLWNRTTPNVTNPDIRPVVKCTSLSQRKYKCEWKIVSGVNYTYEYKTTGNWNRKTTRIHSGKMSIDAITAYVYNDNIQHIRVNATKDNSRASWTKTYDIIKNLKPTITYIGSTMKATSATLTWSTENTVNFLPFISEFKASEECDDETSETCQRIELLQIYHENNPITITTNNLKPGRYYKFYIRSRYELTGNNFTSWTNVSRRTNEIRPSQEVQFESIENHGDGISLNWTAVPKDRQNGNILGYKIYVNDESYEVNNTQYSLREGIGYDVSYNICITAYNSAGESPINCQTMELISTTKTYEGTMVTVGASEKIYDNRGTTRHGIQPSQAYSKISKDTINFSTLVIAIGIVLVGVVAAAYLYRGYSKLKNKFFMEWPEPNFTKITFNEVTSPVRESEIFDELCVRRTTVNISERRCSTDNDIHQLTPNILTDGCRMVQNHSYLKSLGTESTNENSVLFPEDVDEFLNGPVIYRRPIFSEKNSDVQSVQNENLRSESKHVDYIGRGAVMCIDSMGSSKITGDKTALPIKNNGCCSMPPCQCSDHKVITPCPDGGIFVCPDSGYIASCLDHGGIAPLPNNVAQISDHKGIVPCLEQESIAPSFDDGVVAPCSNQLGQDSPLKQDVASCSDHDPLVSCSDHKCTAPRSGLNGDSCSDYLLITAKTVKLPDTRPTENNNNDYVTMTCHTGGGLSPTVTSSWCRQGDANDSGEAVTPLKNVI